MSIRTIISAGNRLAATALFTTMKGGEALTDEQAIIVNEAREAWKLARREFPDTEPAGWRDFLQMCSECSGGMVNGNQLALKAKSLLGDVANPVAHKFDGASVAETWAVTVEANGERILCISDQHLAGAPEMDLFEETIKCCAGHLLSFIDNGTAKAPPVLATEPDHLTLLELYQIVFDDTLQLGDRLQRITSRIQQAGTDAQRQMRREEQQEAAALQTLLMEYYPQFRQPYPNGLFGWAAKTIYALQFSNLKRDSRMSDASHDVLAERQRQQSVEGWAIEMDDGYRKNELSNAAACYASAGTNATGLDVPALWPYSHSWWKPTTPRRNLVKAAALCIAEIERIDRAEARLAAAK